MTRKEELERRALSFLANEHVEPSDLTAMLLQVEREVWERVAEHCHYKHNDGYTLNDVLGCGNEGDVVTGASNDEFENYRKVGKSPTTGARMMTREQRILRIVSTLRPTDPGSWGPNTHYVTMEFNEHDAEQRATIEQLEEKVKAYEGGCPHDSLGDQARTIEQQAQEIARLREVLQAIVYQCEDEDWEYMLGDILEQAQQALKETTT